MNEHLQGRVVLVSGRGRGWNDFAREEWAMEKIDRGRLVQILEITAGNCTAATAVRKSGSDTIADSYLAYHLRSRRLELRTFGMCLEAVRIPQSTSFSDRTSCSDSQNGESPSQPFLQGKLLRPTVICSSNITLKPSLRPFLFTQINEKMVPPTLAPRLKTRTASPQNSRRLR